MPSVHLVAQAGTTRVLDARQRRPIEASLLLAAAVGLLLSTFLGTMIVVVGAVFQGGED